jgi:predicted secreted Zn-dependent protease
MMKPAFRRAIYIAVVVAPIVATGDLKAEVRSSTELHAYVVGGTTAASLVAYMRKSPFPGDSGPAVANIRPHYTLSIDTTDNDAVCKPRDIDLDVNFVMTLPEARTPVAFSPSTRSAWDNFVDFAKRHEETHRGIYLDCANDFAAKALQLTAASCASLRESITAMFQAETRACDRRQRAFDRAQYRIVLGLSLFASARYAGRKPAATSSFAQSSAMRAPSR